VRRAADEGVFIVKRATALIGLFLLAAYLPLRGGVVHVPTDQPTIQAGIDASVNGDTVLIGAGIFTGLGNRDIDFGGKKVVLKSVSGPDLTMIDCQGTDGDRHRGFYLHRGEDSSSVIEGLRIRNGYGPSDGFASSSFGGAICIRNASPRIIDCRFDTNYAYSGGAIYADSSSAKILGCSFIGNGFSDGGGICVENCTTVVVYGCTFSDNFAAFAGGAIKVLSSRLVAGHCTFSGNVAASALGFGGAGGGIYVNFSEVEIAGCSFIDNLAWGYGGAVASQDAHISISTSLFYGNYVTPEGLLEEIYPDGCALFFQFSDTANVDHCTFVANRGYFGNESVIHTRNSLAVLRYCIAAYSRNSQVAGCYSNVKLLCSNLYGNENGNWDSCLAAQGSVNGNFSTAPLFCDTASGSYYLSEASPCAPANNSCGVLIGSEPVGCFECGDANTDGGVDVSDVVFLIQYIFAGGGPLHDRAADADCNGGIDISDAVYLIGYIFAGGPAPCASCK
jgi:predicted outer membrane repeat protein